MLTYIQVVKNLITEKCSADIVELPFMDCSPVALVRFSVSVHQFAQMTLRSVYINTNERASNLFTCMRDTECDFPSLAHSL